MSAVTPSCTSSSAETESTALPLMHCATEAVVSEVLTSQNATSTPFILSPAGMRLGVIGGDCKTSLRAGGPAATSLGLECRTLPQRAIDSSGGDS